MLLLSRSRPGRWVPVTAIAVIGFVAMGQEILCLYLYQALRGYLYSRLGIIVALFMAGLSVGGWWGTRWTISHPQRVSRLLLLLEVSLAALCLGLPFGWAPLFLEGQANLALSWTVEAGVALWMALAGFGTGAAFPLACELMHREGYDLPGVAGSMDAADHLGAAAGSLLTGTLLVPVFGLSKASLWMALLLIACCSLLLFTRLDLPRKTR
jgi:spermidine synthase